MVGRETAARDDPLLTARPPGPRTAVRVVLDTHASLDSQSQLVRTAAEAPVLVAVGQESSPADRLRLRNAGCEVFVCDGQIARRTARRPVGRIGAAAVHQRAGRGGRPLAGQLARCAADRRSSRLYRAEAPRRRRGPYGHRRRGNCRRRPRRCDWKRWKSVRWPTTRIFAAETLPHGRITAYRSRPDAGRILGQEVAWAAGRVVGIRDGAAGRPGGRSLRLSLHHHRWTTQPADVTFTLAGRVSHLRPGRTIARASTRRTRRRTSRRRICRSPGPGRNCRPCTPKDAAHAA